MVRLLQLHYPFSFRQDPWTFAQVIPERQFTLAPTKEHSNVDLVTGNMEELLHRHAWGFVDELGTKYGKIVKLTGQLGVSNLTMFPSIITTHYVQSRILYVWDPLAMHHVFVKDGDHYDLPEWGIEYVPFDSFPDN